MTSPPRPYPHPHPNPAWLALRTEAPLLPDLPVIDAHHHLWERPGEEYLTDSFLADIAAGGHRVVGSVFVQCAYGYRQDGPAELRPVGETERVVATTRDTVLPVCQAIVGYADLRLGSRAAAVLEAHLAAGEGRFKGVRQSASVDPDIVSTMSATPPPGLMQDPEFRRGFACLERLGLSFDAWVYHPQLHELAELAEAFPGVPVAVNHVGGFLGVGRYHGRQDVAAVEWRDGIARLARLPNVFMKLGGLARPVSGFDWHELPEPLPSAAMAEAWRPWMAPCIDAFGPERCMFESNFPVDKGLCSYGPLWNAFKRLAAEYSTAERSALFAGTAARFYRIA